MKINKDRLEAMSRLGVEASKAGESLRKCVLAMQKLKSVRIKNKRNYKFHK